MEYLQFEANSNGSFLIRASVRNDQSYAISLKAKGQGTGEGGDHSNFIYKHYLILQNEAKTQFWIKGADR